ncbi:MAG: hypothetical protein ACOYVK_13745 [Bacillota bacterium]
MKKRGQKRNLHSGHAYHSGGDGPRERDMFDKIADHMVMSDGMLSTVDQTDYVNFILTEESIKRALGQGERPQDPAP